MPGPGRGTRHRLLVAPHMCVAKHRTGRRQRAQARGAPEIHHDPLLVVNRKDSAVLYRRQGVCNHAEAGHAVRHEAAHVCVCKRGRKKGRREVSSERGRVAMLSMQCQWCASNAGPCPAAHRAGPSAVARSRTCRACTLMISRKSALHHEQRCFSSAARCLQAAFGGKQQQAAKQP